MIRTGFACLHLLLFNLVLLPPTHAQPQAGPYPPDNGALKKAILVYTRSKSAEASLYNGMLYTGYDLQSQGHPFFLSDTPILGSIIYDSTCFPDIPLSYDVARDIVVIPDKGGVVRIQLNSDKLQYFTIGEHQFIHLAASSGLNAPAEGYYEVLHSGKATALVRYRKVLQGSGKAEENAHYQQYKSWYLQLNGRYYPVRNRRDLLNIPDPHNNALKDYLKKDHVSFKKDPEHALIKAAEFYSQAIK